MADDVDEVLEVKGCLNPDCTGKNPMKGNWCTARECKAMRALAKQKTAGEGGDTSAVAAAAAASFQCIPVEQVWLQSTAIKSVIARKAIN